MKLTLTDGTIVEGTIEEFTAMGMKLPEQEAESVTVADSGYKLVTDRKAKAGDFVKFTELAGEDCADYITVGDKFYEIIGIDAEGDPKVYDNDGDIYDTYGDKFDVYEKAAEDSEVEENINDFKVGDTVKLVSTTYTVTGYDIGQIVKVVGLGGHHGNAPDRILCERHDGLRQSIDYRDLEKVDVTEKPYEKPSDIITCNGKQYENIGEVDAEKGDLVRFYNTHRGTSAGKFYEVGDSDSYQDDEGDVLATEGWGGKDRREVFRLVQGEITEQMQIGDYVKITANHEHGIMRKHGFNLGEIVRVLGGVECTSRKDRIRAEHIDGHDFWYVHVDDFVRATDAEVAEAKKELEPALKVGDYVKCVSSSDPNNVGRISKIITHFPEKYKGYDFAVMAVDEPNRLTPYYSRTNQITKATDEEIARAQADARLAKIGRKPNEFKKGDIVRVINVGTHNFDVGDITEIIAFDGCGPNKIRGNIDTCPYLCESEIELITPVEHRFDLGGDAE